jgi:hypothetical protein
MPCNTPAMTALATLYDAASTSDKNRPKELSRVLIDRYTPQGVQHCRDRAPRNATPPGWHVRTMDAERTSGGGGGHVLRRIKVRYAPGASTANSTAAVMSCHLTSPMTEYGA